MKILYKNLPFKTDRNILTKFDGGVHINRLPKNSNVNIVTIKLPKYVYHISSTPITKFDPHRIFYVSFDKFQSLAHGLYLKKDEIHPWSTEKLYFYKLEPKRKTINVIYYDSKVRPKQLSNALGIQYDTFKNSSAFKLSFMPNKINKNNFMKTSFREGSGDNMLLGHILCTNLSINGIRNAFDQDELALCNPKDFFKIADKRIINIKDLGNIRNSIYSIKFNKQTQKQPMQYKSNNSNSLTKIINNKSDVNVKDILNYYFSNK